MSRIKINLPDKYIFSTELPPRISDINYGGHLGHDSVLSLTHEARVRFLTEHNYTEMDIEGVGLIMSEVGITYKSETFYGDIVKIHIGVGELGKTYFEMIYFLENKKNNKEIARVKTRMVLFDYEQRKTMEIPKPFRKLLST
ncbi:MAG: thioesterase [Candidatus Dadabacteria bacterium]|nr:thioesterase [Candidatus Dadabacteria bacterium]NIQ13431.1 thioesterase [Candidatus Dadabacteria bacterium]